MNNLHPIHDSLVSRQEKENLLAQRGMVFWFTGLSGSGKSTIATAFQRTLYEYGYVVEVLDGLADEDIIVLPATGAATPIEGRRVQTP